ncbi:hypothetical protein PSECIP111951_01457 [Pseudoalteromonas holothuriae]|uniref:Acyltransferase n=1 Tax=Pseudoalteromonas holothuriae TaxID=2963714 RepID=A0ABM9GHH9_9GAMM|nr:acyltransferase family protein [Pseudoalteromonas sp. CIP111951]CAH9056420.1 hypothetical protein PSECIP111951_01457 [Pseudoalteromonas sp. CIP111951]
MSSLQYRADIDGLRALAVLSVITFHFDMSYLTGGFLGVDIFFVISGYLITSIIYKEKLNDKFSYREFYSRRAKRILPPLFFMLTLVLAVGWYLMLPYDFYKLGVSAISVLMFASNMQYALRSGDYFSADSSEWPLLHTWSLAVEEQYYFIFPITLFLLLKFLKQHTLLTLALIMVASFGLAEWMSRTAQFSSLSYYLIVTRMGELLVGSLLAIAHRQKLINMFTSNFVATSSFLLIIGLLFLVDKSIPFPGVIALLLCFPVAILINSRDTLINKIFSNSALVYIGLLSYSLYLFHWPVLAFMRYLFNVEVGGDTSLSLVNQVFALIIIVILSLISYYLVEKPARTAKSKNRTVLFSYFIIPTFCIGLFSSFLFVTKGYPDRFSTENSDPAMEFSHIEKDICPSLVKLNCVGGKEPSEKRIVLFGNSHAEHYFGFVSRVAKLHNYKLGLYATGGCSITFSSFKCQSLYKEFMGDIERKDAIIIALRWDTISNSILEKEMQKLISEAKKHTSRVIVLAQPPALKYQPEKAMNCEKYNLNCVFDKGFSEEVKSKNLFVEKLALDLGVEFFDPLVGTNKDDWLMLDRKLNFYDDNHLSVYGNIWLFNNYKNSSPKSLFKM